MTSDQLVTGNGSRYFKMLPESSLFSFHHSPEATKIFDQLPRATIVSVSRPDAGDISPMLLSYTIDLQYKQVREWLQNMGIGDHTAVVQDEYDPDDETVLLHESVKNRDVPSSAALPVIKPALGRQQSISDRAKVAMQGYLNHFLGNMDIVNSREVCRFLEVSKLSFSPEYGPKMKEDYVMVKHLPKIQIESNYTKCCFPCCCCCNDNWQKQIQHFRYMNPIDIRNLLNYPEEQVTSYTPDLDSIIDAHLEDAELALVLHEEEDENKEVPAISAADASKILDKLEIFFIQQQHADESFMNSIQKLKDKLSIIRTNRMVQKDIDTFFKRI